MRSILKHPHLSDLSYLQQCPEPFPFATCPTVEVSTRVHFPPTPTLTSIFITHSSAAYDRTPAEVPPNVCALPGRHEREFIDTAYPHLRRRRWDPNVNGSQGSYFEPRGSEPSDSDDSDVLRTPPESASSGHPISVRFGSRDMSDAMLPYSSTRDEIESALLFLPHASDRPLKKGNCRSPSMGRTPSKGPRRKSADGRIPSDFTAPALDFEGCLGGF